MSRPQTQPVDRLALVRKILRLLEGLSHAERMAVVNALVDLVTPSAEES